MSLTSIPLNQTKDAIPNKENKIYPSDQTVRSLQGSI